MEPRPDPYGPGAAWSTAARQRPLPMGGQPPPGSATDDLLVRVGGWALAAAAVTLVAVPALAVAAVAYATATWRRWRWWPLAVAGLVALAVVILLRGPAGAVEAHALAVRELSEPPAGLAIADLIGARWSGWLAAQVPLSVGAGLVVAALARHQVTHLPAHELAPLAQRRRRREAEAAQTKAARRSAAAPLDIRGAGVLGAWISGEGPTGWRAGRWATIPDPALGLGTLLVGLPGAGKTETLLRLAQLGLARGWDVHVLDAKGDPATATRFAALAAAHGVEARMFPAEPYDGWRGEPAALRNRLSRIVDYSEPYYQDGARVLLDAATCGSGGPPRSTGQLLTALAATPVDDLDPQVRKGTLARYRSFAAAVGADLDGTWAYEDSRASYLLLDGLTLGDDAPRLARYLVEDFAHYAAARKNPDRKTLLLVDEFSALRLPNAAALVERLRSFGAGIVIAAQSIEGLHDEPAERDRLCHAASTIIAHRIADPDPVVTRAGTTRRAERSHQLDGSAATGTGSLRMQDAYRIDPNDLRSLPPGVAWIVHGGKAAKTAITRTRAQMTDGPECGHSWPVAGIAGASLPLDEAPDQQGPASSSPAAQPQPPSEPALPGADQRTWLDVPYHDKDDAKRLGARWDPKARRWYTTGAVDQLARWAPRPTNPTTGPAAA